MLLLLKKTWDIKRKYQFHPSLKRSTIMTLPRNEKPMRTITLEEHFATPEFMEGPGQK
jgi:hypothetical protein